MISVFDALTNWALHIITLKNLADVAQLVRASVCGTEGRGFKSHHSPHYKTPCVNRGFYNGQGHGA